MIDVSLIAADVAYATLWLAKVGQGLLTTYAIKYCVQQAKDALDRVTDRLKEEACHARRVDIKAIFCSAAKDSSKPPQPTE
jgi:hypothetical protein